MKIIPKFHELISLFRNDICQDIVQSNVTKTVFEKKIKIKNP